MSAAHLSRPRREPDLTFRRPSDNGLTEVWVQKSERKATNRHVQAAAWYRAVVSVDGYMVWSDANRHPTPEAALEAVTSMFPQGIEAAS